MSDPFSSNPPSPSQKFFGAIDAYANLIALAGSLGLVGGFVLWFVTVLPMIGLGVMMFSLGALCVCMIGHLSVSNTEPILSLGRLTFDDTQKVLPPDIASTSARPVPPASNFELSHETSENELTVGDAGPYQRPISSVPPSGRELSQIIAANPERIMANVTATYLMEQFDGRTTAEGHRIVGPYVGKWLKVGAAVNDVQEHGRETQLTLSPRINSRQKLLNPGYIFVWGASQQWKDRASILKPGDIVQLEGQILRINAFAITLVQAEFIQGDDKYGDDPARLTVSFDEHYDHNRIQNITHHRFRVHNPFLPVAQNVQARLIDITPRPKAAIFAADFPYRLKTVDGEVRQDINHATSQFFELCKSWISGTTGELMVGGLDTRNNHPVPIEPDEVWHLKVEVSCANAPVETIFFRLAASRKALHVAQVDVWPQHVPQVTMEPLVVTYNGGRYDHKVSKDGKIVYRIIRLQLENKGDQTINGIKVKAERFDSLGTIIPQVPLRICHDEHNNKKDGFPLTPGEKEMVDVVEKAIDWDVTRLCHPLSPDIVTRETDFKVTVVVTAEKQLKKQKRLRIAVDDAEVLRCDALKT